MRIKTHLCRVAIAVLALTAVGAAARPDAAAAATFSDGSFVFLQINCHVGGSISQTAGFYRPYNGAYEAAPVAYYRTWIFNSQTGRWTATSWFSSIPSFSIAGPSLWPGGVGAFTFYGEYARPIGGRWEYRGEWLGRCSFGAFASGKQIKKRAPKPTRPPVSRRPPR